ncbi:uncharacterized protein LOC115226072 isoform X3 [Octopus sinensis]|uniref:Uncharacterized protein LOC115226072 isoform X3 n=1 Tax=Octopus sinensis TaxID=2607531 RepID=A0A7E6FTB9_9MOLL|nr:uncharacterized protein LOC115226072 isoform X3 [Octopus sinensis]
MVGARASKRQCTSKNNNREVLSDFNEKLLECVELSDSHTSDSSCDSSSPIVKRHRKTKRKVLDPSQIESSENVQVYSSIAKKSFEKIHSAQFDFSAFCVGTNDHAERTAENSNTGETETPGTTASHEENNFQSSPSPPTPPPPLRIRNTRRLSSRTEISRKITTIKSNIRKFDQMLHSSQIPFEKHTPSASGMMTTTRGGSSNEVCVLDDSVIIVDDDDGDNDNDDCCICEEGSGGGRRTNRRGRINSGHESHTSIPENRRIVVMVKVELEVKRFEMNYNDTFCQLFADLARDLQVTEDRLILLLNDTTIHQNESPASVQLRVSDILVCLVSVDTDCGQNMAKRTGPNIFQLVIQSNGQKRCNVNMSVGKFETIQSVLDIYRKQQNLNTDLLKLYFDGELLNTTLTPAAYGIEDGDCLDLVVET